ncbi:hypothetical protein [Micromonospora echinofusca]|uniref:Uncharacterized protein n=1 Tax=Micromonospora echinofusca TaxID=47858 RepID=A0ABS3VPT1_MICEH|nr:hypothetical protein [Micromonospora echinofusca]MBO4206517.1 hypothetical protein [Micromonospora echinofusca]
MPMLEITLNARLRPLDRGDVYEDPLLEELESRSPGSEIVGGGTMMSPEGEPLSCDVAIDLAGDPQAGLALVVDVLQRLGAPRGSTARLDDAGPVVFGATEGVGLYLNGTDLPRQVYADNDINELIGQLTARLGESGELHSYWEGPRETALYFYGPSARRMVELMRDVLDTHPLAQRSRLVNLTDPDAAL